MDVATTLRYLGMRLLVLGAAVGSVAWLQGLPAKAQALNLLLLFQAMLIVVGTVVLRKLRDQRAALVVLLAADLLLVAVVGSILLGTALHDVGVDLRAPFVAAFLVANLVAMVGHRMDAAALGTLAGCMVLGLGTVLFAKAGSDPDVPLLGMQLLLIGVAAYDTALVSMLLYGRASSEQVAGQIATHVATRESEATELGEFAHALVEIATLPELAEVALDYMRRRFPLRARAVALSTGDDTVALWEEEGRLEKEDIEVRKERLQASLARTGSRALIQQFAFRPVSGDRRRDPQRPRTLIEIPVKVGERSVGVLFVADPEPDVVAPHRIGVLAEVARRTGEALQRVERQQELQTRQTQLLLREMSDGVLLLDKKGDILIANPAARRWLDVAWRAQASGTRRRIGNLSLDDLARIPPGMPRRFRASITDDVSGELFSLTCSAVSVLDEGRRVGTLVTMVDVTEEDQAQRRLMQAERLSLVGQTLAGVAHELNNPLAALIGYADLLQIEKLPENLQRPVEKMRDQATRATRIVKNLLNFARRRNPERVSVGLGELIEGTIELFDYEARIAKVTVNVELDQRLPPVLADRHAIQQILVNLIQNALHAMQTLPPERERQLIVTASHDEEEGQVQVMVRDSGNGVPDELRARVFDAFFTTKRAGKGTGLGLAISRSTAREHGGDLLLAHGKGGACFTLLLPVQRVLAFAETQQADPRRVVPHKVLVVDDEDSVRETVVALLGTMGSRVDSASGPAEALRLIAADKYDVVLMDLRMPGTSGIELHAEIAETDAALARRVVFMTGDFVNEDLLAEVGATGQSLLEKPFTKDELTEALALASQVQDDPLGATMVGGIPMTGADRIIANDRTMGSDNAYPVDYRG